VTEQPKQGETISLPRYLGFVDGAARRVGEVSSAERDAALVDYFKSRKLMGQAIHRFFGDPGLQVAAARYAAPEHQTAIALLRERLTVPGFASSLSSWSGWSSTFSPQLRWTSSPASPAGRKRRLEAMKNAIGITLVFGAIAMFVWNSVPRLMSDVWHARDFVPAQGYMIKKYECTNVNGFMFNDCTVTFVSLQSGESRQITDWRFGRAPRDPVQLLQRRDDVSSVTTDVSLQTLWNRVLVAFTLVGFGAVLALALLANAFKVEDAPIGAPSREPSSEPSSGPSGGPALGPMGRPTFGKRQA
jgi:hypothetical protein